MSLNDRYLVFNYLKNNADLNQLLISNAGLHPSQAKLIPLDEFLSINVETYKNHYNNMRQNLINIIKDLKTKTVPTSSYISLYSDFTNPIDGKKIRRKIQETFNVVIAEQVKVEFIRHGNRGMGMIGAGYRKAPGTFHV